MNEPSLKSDTVRSTFDRSEKPPSIAVVETIAAIEDMPPTDFSITLPDFIKTTSLNELVNSNSDDSVTFSVDQYQIQVNGNTIAVTPC